MRYYRVNQRASSFSAGEQKFDTPFNQCYKFLIISLKDVNSPVFDFRNVWLDVVLCLKTNLGQNTSFDSLSALRHKFKANGFKYNDRTTCL